MTDRIWAPRPYDTGSVCIKIPYRGFLVSIAVDDSCGVLQVLQRGNIIVFQGDEIVSHQFGEADAAGVLPATAEQLRDIFARIDGDLDDQIFEVDFGDERN